MVCIFLIYKKLLTCIQFSVFHDLLFSLLAVTKFSVFIPYNFLFKFFYLSFFVVVYFLALD